MVRCTSRQNEKENHTGAYYDDPCKKAKNVQFYRVEGLENSLQTVRLQTVRLLSHFYNVVFTVTISDNV